MILDILTYPDKRLWQKSNAVQDFDDKLHTFLDDLYETMVSKDGIGLAAIQVGKPLDIFIINLFDDEAQMQKKEDLVEFINPKITKKTGEAIYQEGCLSVPGFYEDIKRAEFIEIEFQNRFGEMQKREFDGLFAIAIQHEFDHLEGHLFIEKLSYNKRKRFEKEFKKTKKN